jgi:hypothetical protein
VAQACILATQKAEIRRLIVQSQPGQILHETLSQQTFHKNMTGGVAQGEGPKFKPQCWKKNKQKKLPKLCAKNTNFKNLLPKWRTE